MTKLLVARTAPAHVWECTDLPLWVRVTTYAVDHHGEPLSPGQLRATLDPTAHPSAISRAISRGISAGLLAHDSTARCLYSRVGRS